MNLRKELRRSLIPLIAFVMLVVMMVTAVPAMALTTADVTVTATPSYIAIAVNINSFDFGTVAVSAWSNTTNTTYFYIDNTSSVQTDQTIAVVNATWLGGVAWTHDDTATIGADTCALLANKGGAWGTGDVIVKNAAPNDIATDQAATTDYQFGLALHAPTSFSDGVEKDNIVRVSAAAG